MFWSFWNFLQKYNFLKVNYNFFPLFSCVQKDLCYDNRNENGVVQFAAEDILNILISSAQNANCPDGGICCATKFTKQLFEEEDVDYPEEPDPCESYALNGKFVVDYNKTIQAEKFNYM